MSFSPASLQLQLMQLPVPRRYLVAYSGGLDSHVLLHALVQLHELHAGPPISAIHVDHGIHPDSTKWARHCQQVCTQLGIDLDVRGVKVRRQNGFSLEALAREARYRVLTELCQDHDMLLLAHHRDDQAETLLLQLLRGSGVKGLAAMPVCSDFAGGWLARPLLNFARSDLLAYAQDRQLAWIEDPSNSDTAFDRNFLRHEIMPQLQRRWPAASKSLARAARMQAEASRLLEQLADQDLERVMGPQPQSLFLPPLRSLVPERQRNLIRVWLQRCGLPLPAEAQLQRILKELLSAAEDASPLVRWPGAEVRRYRELMYAMAPQVTHSVQWRQHWDLHSPLTLPSGDSLTTQCVRGDGLSSEFLTSGVVLRYRLGGEQCRLPGRVHHHSLKKLFQTWGVPPWQRDRIPLVFIGEELAQVVGFCICAPFAAQPGETGVKIIRHVRNVGIETAGENKDNNPGCTQ